MLLIPRDYVKPYEYPEFQVKMKAQQMVHWTEEEIALNADVQDWKTVLTEDEKIVVGGILKMFTQTEVTVSDYWAKVGEWFPLPEINLATKCFGYFEGIHQASYSLLNDTLGFTDYKAFMQDPTALAKIERLSDRFDLSFSTSDRYVIKDCYLNNKSLPPHVKTKIKEVGLSLAIFSAFTEGVMLFSSFAVLLSFQLQNKMKGVGQIVSFSIRDERLHSETGIYLFNLLCREYPWLKKEIEQDIIEAANATIQLETNFINSVFDTIKEIPTLKKSDLIEFIKHQGNLKLKELEYNPIFDVNKEAVEKMAWFNQLSNGREFGDFFATRVTEYSKVDIKADDLF